MITFFLLAQDVAPDAAPDAPPSSLPGMLVLMLPIVVIWFVMFIRPQNKERAKRQEMLGGLKKNDRVATIGGILGTVSHISDDNKEVTLRVDDNTRLKFRREAISEVLSKEGSDSGT